MMIISLIQVQIFIGRPRPMLIIVIKRGWSSSITVMSTSTIAIIRIWCAWFVADSDFFLLEVWQMMPKGMVIMSQIIIAVIPFLRRVARQGGVVFILLIIPLFQKVGK